MAEHLDTVSWEPFAPDYRRDLVKILAIPALLFVKSLLFYHLMGVDVHFLLVSLSTAAILSLLFFGFRNQWIPLGIYMALSLLMFCDAAYNAYYGGYLSVGMAGSAKYLPQVMDLVSDVVEPKFYLLFLDLPVLAALIGSRRHEGEEKEKRKKRFYPFLLTALALLAALIFAGIAGGPFLRSVGNLELLSHHVKDVLQNTVGALEPEGELPEVPGDYRPDPQDPLFGIARGKNLILVQMESLQNFVVGREYEGQELTPVMNGLIQDSSLYFDHYYMQIGPGNTSDAEFAVNHSLYGSASSFTYQLYGKNHFRGLPALLSEGGYETVAMHGADGAFWNRREAYQAQGFQTFIDEDGYEISEVQGWGLMDHLFFEQSAEYLTELSQPFYAFLVSLTNHTPFEMKEEYSFIDLLPKHQGTRFGNYLNCVHYTDQALGVFIDRLKEEGLYDHSVLVVYGDHFGMGNDDKDNSRHMEEFLGRPYDFSVMANIPMIIHIPGLGESQVRSIAAGQLDFLPTMAYLLGFEELDTLYLGQNLLKAREGFVAQRHYVPMGSFISDQGVYLMNLSTVFEDGRAFDPETGEALPIEGFRQGSEKAAALLGLSDRILKEDAIESGSK